MMINSFAAFQNALVSFGVDVGVSVALSQLTGPMTAEIAAVVKAFLECEFGVALRAIKG